MQFSWQCPKNTTCCEQSLESDKKRFLQIPAPTDGHFDVPDGFAPFLLQDSGKDDNERIPISGNATMKNLLNLSNTWLVELLNCHQKSFIKLTIHVRLHGFAPPCVYVLPSNKTEKTYTRDIELLNGEANHNPGKKLQDYCAPSAPSRKN